MRTERGMKSASGGVARAVVLALLASVLMWLAVQWGLTILKKPLYAQQDVDGLLALAWVGLIAGPVLSTTIALLLLPEPLRGRFGPALLVGPAVTTVASAIAVLRYDAGPQTQGALAALGLIGLAVVTAWLVTLFTGRRTASADFI